MSDIWNLSTLCRCCHTDGQFKSLGLVYQGPNGAEIYEDMLRETFGVTLYSAPLEASYTICDQCINHLKAATEFKKNVLLCDQKFKVYCTNEQFLSQDVVKLEMDVSHEVDTGHDHYDNDAEIPVEVKQEFNIEIDFKEEFKTEENQTPDLQETTKDISNDLLIKKNVSNNKNKDKQVVDEKKSINKKIKIIKNEAKNDSMEVKKLLTENIIEKETKDGLQYSCKLCKNDKCFKTKKLINRHIYYQHRCGKIQCEFCPKILSTKMIYKRHLKLHSKALKLKCEYCDIVVTSEKQYKKHILTHEPKVYICDICKKNFKCKQTLKRHLIWHAGKNKKILCELCGWSFNDKTQLTKHTLTVHENQRPYKCTICTKAFKANKNLKHHLKFHSLSNRTTETMEPYFECDICLKKYRTQKFMQNHKLSHKGIFCCAYCDEHFGNKEMKSLHVKMVHNQVFPCDLCGKEFLSKFSLNRHLDQHNGILRFSCDICDRKFTQKSLVKRHKLRKHTDTKIEFVNCEICKRRVKNLKSHMLSHNARIYACDMCDKKYPASNNLMRHKEAVHYGRNFTCEVCNKTYIQRAKLRTHRRKVHNLDSELPEACESRVVKNDDWINE